MKNDLLNFQEISDYRGSLISFEELKNIPFEVKRVYYIYNVKKDMSRGLHAHKNLQQVLVCVKGSCVVKLDDGMSQQIYDLNKPFQGLLVDKMIWHEMYDFSEDCLLMAIANNYYDEDDYIRDYDEFLRQTVSISFETYNISYLNFSKKWLRDPEIKRLTMTPDFDDETQLKWFHSLQSKENYYIKGIKYKNKPIGAMGLKNINNNCGEYWGYIGEKKYWGIGLGKYLIEYSIRYAKSLGLEYLYLKVDETNKRAIRLYEKNNFKVQFLDNNIIYMIKNI